MENVISLCVDVLARANLDMPVTIRGNDYQSFEVAGLAEEVLARCGCSEDQISHLVSVRETELYFEINGW